MSDVTPEFVRRIADLVDEHAEKLVERNARIRDLEAQLESEKAKLLTVEAELEAAQKKLAVAESYIPSRDFEDYKGDADRV